MVRDLLPGWSLAALLEAADGGRTGIYASQKV